MHVHREIMIYHVDHCCEYLDFPIEAGWEASVDYTAFSLVDMLVRTRHGVMEELSGFSRFLHIIPYVG